MNTAQKQQKTNHNLAIELPELPQTDSNKASSKKSNRLYMLLPIALIVVCLSAWFIYDTLENKRIDAESVFFKEDLTVEFGDEAKVTDFLRELKGELVEDYSISTDKLGETEVTFNYINRKNRKRTIKFKIEVVDTVKPEIFGRSSYSVEAGYNGNLTDLMLSGDNLDDYPERKIEGEYDTTEVGAYDLEYVITDASGNQNRQPFTLYVVEPAKDEETSSDKDPEEPLRLEFTDVIKDYKTKNTKVGIDVSVWQGEIDWSAVKAAGAEFAFIRVGYQDGFGGENILDKRFADNIAGATKAGLPVGVYFYSYAQTLDQAESQARWIREQIGDYPIELGIAFDWENWSSFNTAGVSFHKLNKMFEHFANVLSESDLGAILYGSKYYLENIWQTTDQPVWLAQYYDYVTYTGDYVIWQMSDIGRIKGIDEYVDIDIMYFK